MEVWQRVNKQFIIPAEHSGDKDSKQADKKPNMSFSFRLVLVCSFVGLGNDFVAFAQFNANINIHTDNQTLN